MLSSSFWGEYEKSAIWFKNSDGNWTTMKLPCTAAGIRAVKYFAAKDIRTNCTLVFSVGQALLAAKAGATYVSPFVGRLDDISLSLIHI